MKRTSLSLSLSLTALVGLAGLAGCRSESSAPSSTAAPLLPAPAPPAAPASGTEAQETPTVHAHMAEHYAQAEAMKRGVIAGDLAAYRQAAAWLAEHELAASAPESWQKHASAMQWAAKGGRDATELSAAATALGAMGAACAACHEQLGRPALAAGAPPAEGSGTELHMARHQWAADRLWEGLMAPSDELWVKGAEVLADAPLAPGELAPEQSVPPSVADLSSRVHAQAHAARSVSKEGRAAAYAGLLQSCSGCHGTLSAKLQ